MIVMRALSSLHVWLSWRAWWEDGGQKKPVLSPANWLWPSPGGTIRFPLSGSGGTRCCLGAARAWKVIVGVWSQERSVVELCHVDEFLSVLAFRCLKDFGNCGFCAHLAGAFEQAMVAHWSWIWGFRLP